MGETTAPMTLFSGGLLSLRDCVSVSLLASSSGMEATLNRTMFTAATSATKTRNRIEPSANLALSVRSLKVDISPTFGSRLSGSISLAQTSGARIDFNLTARAMTLNSLMKKASACGESRR
jgi:hypothetical protein